MPTTKKKAAAPKNALSKPVQPDAALAAVVGKDPLPRSELTKKLWEYIRKHELQDPKDKRNIRADERLLAVFDGKKVVSMFEMTKLVNGHLVLSRTVYEVLDGLWVGLGSGKDSGSCRIAARCFCRDPHWRAFRP
jgi:chromatin remodeling complex protein RSC6